jgi:hypothetical protein
LWMRLLLNELISNLELCFVHLTEFIYQWLFLRPQSKSIKRAVEKATDTEKDTNSQIR